MRRVPVYRRSVLKFALTCAVVVGSVAFAANSALADTITITDEAGFRNTANYQSGNILDIHPSTGNTITVYGNILGDNYSISGVTDLLINGNGSIIDSQSKNNNVNSGYQLSNGSTLTINNLTFSNFGKNTVSTLWRDSTLSGAGLYVMTGSSAELNGVSYIENSVYGMGQSGAVVHGHGGAIANEGTIDIVGGSFNSNTLSTEVSIGIRDIAGDAFGGAIYNAGTMTITGAEINDNKASSSAGSFQYSGNAFGGAIYNAGSLTLTGTTIENNSVSSEDNPALGGGIYTTGEITLAGGNTFSNNTDNNGNRANDIYFAGGNLLVNGTGSDEVNTISSGLASSGNSNVILSNGGKLLLNGNNTGFTNGNANVGSDSVLTYGGAGNQSILSGITTVDGNNGAVEFNLDDASYNLDAGKVVTANGVQGQFIKSGDNTLNLTNGDYSSFSGDVIINSGILNYRGGGVYQYVFKSDCSRCDVKL